MIDDKILRIVHLARSPSGGILRHISDLIVAQSAAGHQVGLVCDSLTGGAFEAERIAELTSHLALGVVRLPIARQIGLSDIRAVARVREALKPLRPDVIHCHGAKGGAFGRMVGAWLGRTQPIARFYAPHGGSLHYDPTSISGLIYFRIERALERLTDSLLHVSRYEQRTYVSHIGVPRCPAIVVRNGLKIEEFDPVDPAPDARDFLYMGMLRDLKGVDVFIEAIAILAQSDRPASAMIVGDGPDEERYRAMVIEKGLGRLVSFRPSTPTREAFTLGRAIVVPSRAESMPYVVLEAIAARLPMIATRVGGIPEIFGPFSDDLVPPGDPRALAVAMAAVAADRDAALAGAAARRAHISGEFSVAEMSSRIENVYRVAMARARGRTWVTVTEPPVRQVEPPTVQPTRGRGETALNEQAREIAERFSAASIAPVMLFGLVRGGDAVIAALSGLAAYAAAIGPLSAIDWTHLGALAAAALALPLFVQATEAYQASSFASRAGHLGRVIGAWTLLFAGLALVAGFFDAIDAVERRWFGVWFGLGAAALIVERTVLGALIRGWASEGRLGRKAVIVGGGESAAELVRALEATPGHDVHICGVFDDRSDDRSPAIVAGYPKLGDVAELVEFARIARIDLLIVTFPISAKGRVAEILKTLWVLPVDIRLSAHTEKLRFRPRAYSYVGAVPMVDLAAKPIQNGDVVAKRAFDLVVGTLALIAASPFMLATAVAIKLDSPGPVFFRQKRYGFNNELIEVFKFRSMYVEHTDPTAKKLVTSDDPRVTRVGRFIRKTSIDELPQLLNVVFKGDLSLVGPRPHAVHAKAQDRLYDEVVDGYFARHRVKPGITGWAQINGWRGETDTQEKIEKRVDHDLYYIENWSILFDALILLRTPFALASTENAY